MTTRSFVAAPGALTDNENDMISLIIRITTIRMVVMMVLMITMTKLIIMMIMTTLNE